MRAILQVLRIALSIGMVYWLYRLLKERYKRRQEVLTSRITQLESPQAGGKTTARSSPANANTGPLSTIPAQDTTIAPTAPAAEFPAIARHLEAGNDAFEAGEFERALMAYNSALAIDVNSAATYYNRANVLARMGHDGEARRDYDHALELAPDDIDAYINRGLLSLQEDRFDVALDDFDRALALRPDDAVAHTNRGFALLHLARTEGALEAFGRAVELEPGAPGAHYGIASAETALNQPAAAVRALRDAAQLDPGFAAAAASDPRFVGLYVREDFRALLEQHAGAH